MKKTETSETVLSKIAGVFRRKKENDGDPQQIIIDDSHMHVRETGSRVHFFYIALFCCSIVSALWQHSSPTFTFAMLALLFPAAFLLYVPYRFTNTLLRQLISCAIFFSSCFWIIYRIKKNIPFDLAMVEGMLLGCFSFLVNCTKKDYSYLFFISLFLLIYSGLIPRKLLLLLIPAAAVCLLIISCSERREAFSGAAAVILPDNVTKPRNLLKSWHLILLQLLLAVPLFLMIFSAIPLENSTSDGLFEVSFATERRSVMPPDLRKWLKQDRKNVHDPSGDVKVDGKNPDVPDNSGQKINAPGEPAQSDGGGSGAPPGKDLVFTAVMPVKLYHLAALYDFYDGKKWKMTPLLMNNKILGLRKKSPVFSFSVNGKYTIEKWLSPSLYFPFRFANLQISSPAQDEQMIYSSIYRNIEQNFFGARLKEGIPYPDTPFHYTFSSLLFVPIQQAASFANLPEQNMLISSVDTVLAQQVEKEKQRLEQIRQKELKRQQRIEAQRAKAKARAARLAKARAARLAKAKNKSKAQIKTSSRQKKKVIRKTPAVKKTAKPRPKRTAKARRPRRIPRNAAWLESLPPTHYIQLPEDLSPKIRLLAKSITKNCLTPYEKAIALRNYLRSNYQYRLDAQPVPAGRESVEYFLFELKEGHCEYFAAALTVMARTLKLPARVATGFSPGNYNALTRQIEVYEYHAHAWSQIFIDDLGWLTFDAVPPGDVVSETTPAGIGRLRDPFGDEWRVMPPELTQHTLKFVRKKTIEEIEKYHIHTREKDREKLQHETSAAVKKELKKKAVEPAAKITRQRPAAERIKNFFRSLRERFSDAVFSLFFTADGKKYAVPGGILLLAVSVFLFKTCNILKVICRHFRLILHISLAGRQKDHDPDASLRHLYQAVRLLLELAGAERKNNRELLAYAEDSGRFLMDKYLKKYPDSEDLPDPAEENIRPVFSAFYALEYGNISISDAELAKLIKKSAELFELFCKIYPYSIVKMYHLF